MSVSEQPHLNDPIVVFRGDVPCLPFAEWAVHDYPQVAAAWRLARHARPAIAEDGCSVGHRNGGALPSLASRPLAGQAVPRFNSRQQSVGFLANSGLISPPQAD